MCMDLARFCSSARIMIVAGKGGVGKTTVTATLATAAADAGLSVLIVEVEGKSGLAACFGRPPLGYEEAELAPRVLGRPGHEGHPRPRQGEGARAGASRGSDHHRRARSRPRGHVPDVAARPR